MHLRAILCLVCSASLLLCAAPALAQEELAPTPQTFTISLAGDCTLASEGGLQNRSDGFVGMMAEKGFEWPFSAVRDIFLQDDLTLVNLEGTFTNLKKGADKKFVFRAPPEYADVLTLGGVEAVNLANNHSMDYGQQGFEDTKAALDERGIAYCAPNAPTVTEVNGLRIALLGATYPLSRKVGPLYDQIAAFRAEGVDLVVVSYHWGKETSTKQLRDQIEIARETIDRGADIVVGTHPHVLQGMELYEGKPIFYSLGNFSFGGHLSPHDFDTAIMQVTYDVTPDGLRLSLLRAIPCLITERPFGTKQDYRPVLTDDEETVRRIFRKLAYRTEGLPEDFFTTGIYSPESE